MDLINSISENGILIVIAGVFLYTYITDRKTNKERDLMFNESLKLLSEGNQNIAKILDLLNINACNNDKLLREHDERSITMNERHIQMNEILLNLVKLSEKQERKEIRKEKREEEKKGE